MGNLPSPDVPDFKSELSVSRLKNVDALAFSVEVDLAIAQDVLNKRISAKDIQGLMAEANDYSNMGDSLSSWVFRLGGAKALKESIKTLSQSNESRKSGLPYLLELTNEKEFFLDLAKKDKNIGVISMLLNFAIKTKDDEIIKNIEERLGELKPEDGSYESTIYSWFESNIENYKLEKNLNKGGLEVREVPVNVTPFSEDLRLKELNEKKSLGKISESEFESQQHLVFNTRSKELRNIVTYAVIKGDLNMLYGILGKSGSSGDLINDELQYTLGEVEIISKGINILENKFMPSPPMKPVYMITDVVEAEAEFEKEIASKIYESKKETKDGLKYTQVISPTSDRAYWLIIKLAQLGDIQKLKQVLNNEYASIEIKKEAIRWLLLKNELKFLEGYSLQNKNSVNFWDNKVKLNRSGSNFNVMDDLEKDTLIKERLKEDLPSYVAAIFEAKV